MNYCANKRGKLDLYLDVLKVIRRGESKPTRIMYSANLSWKPMMKILDSLIKQEIIVHTQKGCRNVYSLTKKGIDALDYFQNATLETS